MNRYSWIVICLAYIVGLFATGLFYFTIDRVSWFIILKIGIILFLLGVFAKFIIKTKIDNKVWLTAIIIAILAVVYFNLRIPQPQQNDISNLITSKEAKTVILTGKVLTESRLNSNNKFKFWLQAREVQEKENTTNQSVSGNLYVTVPLLLGNKIYPNQILTLEGALYKPKIPNSPTQFNFHKYLKEHGTFAGLAGWKIIEQSESQWGWYQLRKRIIRAQVKGLGSPFGQLVSSMVLGRRAVDLPEDIRDLFVKSGLAHVLAASGFHVSLLLGVILKLTNFLDEKKQLIIGVITLLIYTLLTGFSLSVIRATLMGIAVLIAIASKAKVRPLGSLLLAATILLLINPLWIWDLGFQLSFLATFGIVVTLPALVKKLDWLPSNMANAIAVPLAASIWVLPLISYVFNTIATYSVLVNLIATPLIAIISLGGMFASAIALIIPSFGSYVAWLLKYPVLLLITIIKFFSNLPGSSLAIGEISLWLLLVIYGLIILIWLDKRFQKYWWLAALLIISLIIIPLRYQQANLFQFSILDTGDQPSIIIQDRGQIIIINSLESKTLKYTTMSFLASQGINHIDYLVITLKQAQKYQTISKIQSQIAVKKIVVYGEDNSFNLTNKINIPLEFNSVIITDSVKINAVDNSDTLQIKTNNHQWLLTDRLSFLDIAQSKQQDVLLWLGKPLNSEILNNFQGTIAIASNLESSSLNSSKLLQIYTTDRHGTISWTPQTGFTTATEKAKRNNTLW